MSRVIFDGLFEIYKIYRNVYTRTHTVYKNVFLSHGTHGLVSLGGRHNMTRSSDRTFVKIRRESVHTPLSNGY